MIPLRQQAQFFAVSASIRAIHVLSSAGGVHGKGSANRPAAKGASQGPHDARFPAKAAFHPVEGLCDRHSEAPADLAAGRPDSVHHHLRTQLLCRFRPQRRLWRRRNQLLPDQALGLAAQHRREQERLQPAGISRPSGGRSRRWASRSSSRTCCTFSHGRAGASRRPVGAPSRPCASPWRFRCCWAFSHRTRRCT